MTANEMPAMDGPPKSPWLHNPNKFANYRSTADIPKEADIVVIGSGISGTSFIYHALQKKKDLDIVLLEARQATSGASGRNGGHMQPQYYHWVRLDRPLSKSSPEGSDNVRRSQFERDCFEDMKKVIIDNDIECETLYLKGNKESDNEAFHIFFSSERFNRYKAKVNATRNAGGKVDDVKIWEEPEAFKLFGTGGIKGAISAPATPINPYKFVTFLLQWAIDRGLNLQTNTTVKKVTHRVSDGRYIVETKDRGSIVADKVVFTTNAYTNGLELDTAGQTPEPLFQAGSGDKGVLPHVEPTQGQVTEFLVSKKSLTRNCPLPGRNLGIYEPIRAYMIHRYTPEDEEYEHFLIGGARETLSDQGRGTWDDSSFAPQVEKELENAFVNVLLPSFSTASLKNGDLKILNRWTGIMGYTQDEAPYIGPIPRKEYPNAYVCVGFSGHGMTVAYRCAEAVTEMILDDEPDKWPEYLPYSYRTSRLE